MNGRAAAPADYSGTRCWLMKFCRKCDTEKPDSDFGKNKRRPTGLQDWCKVCMNQWTVVKREQRREYRSRNLRSINAYKNQWRRDNPDRKRGYDAIRRARSLDQLGEVSPDIQKKLWCSQEGRCFYCTVILGKDYHMDHKTPLSRGGLHDDSNLCLACPACNMQKHDKTVEEFIRG
jgi:hypothetical protein